MVSLPQRLQLPAMQTQWASQLDPIIANPMNSLLLLKGVVLKTGANSVNHRLGQTLQGWFITRYNGSWAQVYDTQASNQTPQLTLNLEASAPVTVDLAVF